MPPKPGYGEKSTVLVVDDTPDNLFLIHGLLSNDYHVKVANDGEKALRIAQSGHSPDLILLDIMMSGMDGYEVCRQLKNNPATRNIPVIFLTGMTEMKDEQKGLQMGAVDYITKPINPPIVMARVANHLALKAQADLMRDRQEELFQTEKLAALGKLVAGIAHELNTPIGSGLTVMSALRDRLTTFREASASKLSRTTLENFLADVDVGSDIAVRSLRRAAELVAGFKQVAVDQANSQRHTFRVREVIDEILLVLRPVIRRTSVLVETEAPEEMTMDSYPGPLGQVLTHLINNALIHGFEDRDQGTLHITAARAQGHIAIALRDDGRGIPAALIGRIFDPFYTTRMGRGSIGLGLYIAHNLVTNVLGGTLTVDSREGTGTEFVMLLPEHAPATEIPH
ncbi:Sensor protein [Gammaproteobacteria bacterium]